MRFIGLLLSLLLLPSCENMNETLVIGHRGAMGHVTENTLASVQKALDMEVDGIEIDVFKIASGETVVFHDNTVDRLTDGSGKIEDYDLFNLKKLTLHGNHHIPLLEDVLKLIDNRVRLNIELKGAGTSKGVDSIMDHFIREQGWSPENFLISSFNWDELREMRKINPNVAIAVLVGDNPLDAIPIAKELKAEAINPSFKTLNLEVVDKIRGSDLKIYTWTVNDPRDIELAKKWAVDAIITNYPERVN